MATLRATTSSNWCKVNPDTTDQIRTVAERYDFWGANGELGLLIKENSDNNTVLSIFGGTAFEVSKPITGEDGSVVDREPGYTEEFLNQLAPFLNEKLVVQYVGHEKCRFPLVAGQWTVWPDGTTLRESFSTSPEKPDDTDQEPQFAVLNTERNLLLKLGAFGPALTSNREKATTKAREGDHLEAVKVETVPVSEAESSQSPST